MATAGAVGSRETVGEDAAAQEGPEVALDLGGNAGPGEIGLSRLRQERLGLVLDDRLAGGTLGQLSGPCARLIFLRFLW